jgi:uncharacterized paraquat-inducible protein A
MNTVTVCCHNCDWVTDFSTISDTNPATCPKCGGEIFVDGTDIPYDEYEDVEED